MPRTSPHSANRAPADNLAILTSLCNLPTAPYREEHVIAWLHAWAARHPRHITTRRDRAGNLYLEYCRGKRSKHPLVLEAHMDHPGFITTRQERSGIVHAQFRGNVKPSHFQNATAQFWLPQLPDYQITQLPDSLPRSPAGRWLPAPILAVKRPKNSPFLHARLGPIREKLPPSTLGMWNLPDAALRGTVFSARVCDDLAGVAAILCLFEALIARRAPAHIVGLLSRAEEVGFAGVLAVCEHRWIPKNSPIISLDTSKALPVAPQGAGPIIRVGDQTGIFSAGLTHFLAQAAGHISDVDSTFHFQRKLMDGGTCSATAFLAWGYDAAALALPLGNYHNQSIPGDPGCTDAPPSPAAGPAIAPETIHYGDFEGLVRILIQTATTIGNYQPGFRTIRDRLTKLHRQEQKTLLYAL